MKKYWIGIGNISVSVGSAAEHTFKSRRLSPSRAFHNSLTHSKRTGLEHCTKRRTRPVYVVCRLLHVSNLPVVFRRGGVIRSEVRSQGESPGQHTLNTNERLDQTLPRDLTINIWMVTHNFGNDLRLSQVQFAVSWTSLTIRCVFWSRRSCSTIRLFYYISSYLYVYVQWG